jgi:transcriptional regulator with XRE-family HTH domain
MPTSTTRGDKLLTMSNVIEFSEWLEAELQERGWNAQDLARTAGIHPSHLYRVLNRERNPGPDVCVAIAAALRLPPDLVFRQAGILPDAPISEPSTETRQMMALFNQLSDDDQRSILVMLRALVQEKSRGTLFGHPHPAEG